MAFYEGSYYSKTLKMDQSLCVIVPSQSKENKPFKTLYLLHGFMGNHTQWMRFSSIERYASEKNLVVVMPDGRNSFYVDHLGGLEYYKALNEDLCEHIERFFNVSKKREDRFVAGLSMGGFGALNWAFKASDKFSKVASLSGVMSLKSSKKGLRDYYPAPYLNMMFDNEKESLLSLAKGVKQLPDIFIACGKDDYLFEENLAFHHALTEAKIAHDFHEAEGVHDWKFWDQWIQEVILWLVG